MTFQFSTMVRNGELDSIETTIGASPIVKIFSGDQPANCHLSDPSGLLVTISCPVDWMVAANNGLKYINGTWVGTATATDTAASFRLYDSTGLICHMQGTVGAADDPAVDMGLIVAGVATDTITTGDIVTIDSFTLSAGNA